MALKRARRVLLSLAARTATATSPKFEEYCHNGARLYLHVSAASGTGGLTVQFQGYDQNGNGPIAFSNGGSTVTATGTYVYEMHPNAAAASGAVLEAVNRVLPATWSAVVNAADGSSYTYSLCSEMVSL